MLQDIAMAIQLYTASSEQDHAGGMCNLGVLYEKGVPDHLEQDLNKARELYEAAATALPDDDDDL